MRAKMLVTVALCLAPLAACTPDDGGSGPQTPPSAKLFLLDGPPAGVSSVVFTIAAIQVHVDESTATDSVTDGNTDIDNDGRWKSLPLTDAQKRIDLVQYQGIEGALQAGEIVLPVGKITQFRLVLDKAGTNTATFSADNSTCNLDLGSVANNGIKVNHMFKAIGLENNDKVNLYLDFDLGASLKAHQGCFQVRPDLKLAKAVKNGQDVAL